MEEETKVSFMTRPNGSRLPVCILNCTPHKVVTLDRHDDHVLAVYPPSLNHTLRGKIERDEAYTFCDIDGTVTKEIPRYLPDEEEWNRINFSKDVIKNIVIVSTIGYKQYEELARRDEVLLVIPGSGPTQCKRENGEIVGIYEFMTNGSL